MNPYEVLGVPENADDATVKKAYRELVKKYHPDNFKDNPLADLANEKLQEVNEAYDMITKGNTGGGYSSSNNSSYNNNSTRFAYVRTLIQQRRLADADAELNRNNDGSAEWHYLKGVVCISKGWHFEGIQHLQTAVNMDPANMEYRNMLNNISMRRNSYTQMGNGYGYQSNDQMCNCCSNLICADCCCEMLGGDLISCC
ncbi:MAG: J domain-containing protein [Clostridia bacterium]|nr:J domain-containing protein [Clostridia bacterium]